MSVSHFHETIFQFSACCKSFCIRRNAMLRDVDQRANRAAASAEEDVILYVCMCVCERQCYVGACGAAPSGPRACRAVICVFIAIPSGPGVERPLGD